MTARPLLVAGLFSGAAFALPGFDEPGGWRIVGLSERTPTRFEVAEIDGARALRMEANVSYRYSRRVRYIVARGAADPLRRWLDERHDLARDFARMFGDEAADVPPLAAIAVGADADNTGARSLGFVRLLRHLPS